MNIFPAIDLYEGKAVRLVKGDFAKLTVYSDDPPALAESFCEKGAKFLHTVDLEGAKSGETPNFSVIEKIVLTSPLKVQVGGGIRSEEVIKRYLDAGVMRVILGTAAVTDPAFLEKSVSRYGEKIAVGVDILNGMVAIKGWTESTALGCFEFFERLEKLGVKTVICTDISKDGLLSGTNIPLYRELSSRFKLDIIASGGVTSLEDIKTLTGMGLYGAILGKAIYTGNIELKAALEAAERGGR